MGETKMDVTNESPNDFENRIQRVRSNARTIIKRLNPSLSVFAGGDTEIILRNQYGEYRVSKPIYDLALDDLFAEIIIPVLLAAGYTKKGLREIIDVTCPEMAEEETND